MHQARPEDGVDLSLFHGGKRLFRYIDAAIGAHIVGRIVSQIDHFVGVNVYESVFAFLVGGQDKGDKVVQALHFGHVSQAFSGIGRRDWGQDADGVDGWGRNELGFVHLAHPFGHEDGV